MLGNINVIPNHTKSHEEKMTVEVQDRYLTELVNSPKNSKNSIKYNSKLVNHRTNVNINLMRVDNFHFNILNLFEFDDLQNRYCSQAKI